MKSSIKIILASFLFIMGLAVIAISPEALAQGAGQAKQGVTDIGGGSAPKLGNTIKDIVNILLYILGAAAVIMIVIGGIRYTLSNGDSSAITSAKNTILYSVVGLVVALMAYAIVNFVLEALD